MDSYSGGLKWAATIIMFAITIAAAATSVIRVSPGATGPVIDGLTWDTAYPSIKLALEHAQPFDEVWVAGGTYSDPLEISRSVSLYGGFRGTETQRDDRRPKDARTYIDTPGGVSVTIDADAVGEPAKAVVIDGFTIRNGQAVGGAFGGGIRCNNTSPVIENNTINGCSGQYGAGIAAIGGSPTIRFNNITGCMGDRGACVYLDGGSAVVEHNTLAGQVPAENRAGGVYIALGDPQAPTSPRITHNWFYGCQGGTGAAVYSLAPGAVIKDNLFQQCVATDLSQGTIADVSGAVERPAGFYNNTLVLNSYNGALIRADLATAVANNVASDNSGGPSVSGDGTATVHHNCFHHADPSVDSAFIGVDHNIGDDPGFAPDKCIANSDMTYFLAVDSPCRDAGDDSVVETSDQDYVGDPRIGRGHVDMGAYEIRPAFTLADAETALRMAGGFDSPSAVDVYYLTGNHGCCVTIADAADIARRVAGIVANP